mmetsp:Transcript_10934/g.21110  ORF Transcript_10934/g.21110 Transcript_10934/m.21110 type:complete len:416 (+) Transcript_10934:87-1334(+)
MARVQLLVDLRRLHHQFHVMEGQAKKEGGGVAKKKFKIPPQVLDFLHDGVVAQSDMEFELKLGQLIDTKSWVKYDLSIPAGRNKIIETNPIGTRFSSQVPNTAFKNLNATLNEWVRDPSNSKYGQLTYTRTLEMDMAYRDENQEKIRVTYSLRGNDQPRAIQKQKLRPKIIYFSGEAELDIRMSAAHEYKVELPEDISAWRADSARVKNRMSYRFDLFQVDITEVCGYKDMTPDQVESLVAHKDFRKGLREGAPVSAFSYSKQEWQKGVVKQIRGKDIRIELEETGQTKTLRRDSPFLEHKEHTILPEVTYEVEVELLPDVLRPAEKRKEVIQQWMEIMFRLRKIAQRPSRHHHHQYYKQKHRHQGERRSAPPHHMQHHVQQPGEKRKHPSVGGKGKDEANDQQPPEKKHHNGSS